MYNIFEKKISTKPCSWSKRVLWDKHLVFRKVVFRQLLGIIISRYTTFKSILEKTERLLQVNQLIWCAGRNWTRPGRFSWNSDGWRIEFYCLVSFFPKECFGNRRKDGGINFSPQMTVKKFRFPMLVKSKQCMILLKSLIKLSSQIALTQLQTWSWPWKWDWSGSILIIRSYRWWN